MPVKQSQPPSLDAPITLDELLDRHARDTLVAGAHDLGCALGLADRCGRLVAGDAPASLLAYLQSAPAASPLPEPASTASIDGKHYTMTPLLSEGRLVGFLVLGGPPALAAHLRRVADTFIDAKNELTQKNRSLARAVERLQEADRVKSNFLATVSHELRTPLTSVIGYSEMLLEGIAGPLNDEQREYVGTVMEKGDQLLQLITGILDISRMEAGEMRVDKALFDLDEAVSVALSTIAPHARRKKLNMSCELAPGLPQVYGDRDKIRQVLLNLLGNAVKFTPEGGRIQVAAKVASDPSIVEISVRDSGIGVPPEYQKRVFDPFFQVDNSSTREYGGTGLGLSIVKRIVEVHGGTVSVHSAKPEGTTFTFTLPTSP